MPIGGKVGIRLGFCDFLGRPQVPAWAGRIQRFQSRRVISRPVLIVVGRVCVPARAAISPLFAGGSGARSFDKNAGGMKLIVFNLGKLITMNPLGRFASEAEVGSLMHYRSF